MTSFLSLGRWLFAIPIALFGLLHLLHTDQMVSPAAPVFIQAGPLWIYLVGAGLLISATTMLLGRYDKPGAALLAGILLLVALVVQAPSVLYSGIGQAAVGGMLKNLSLAGAALLYAQYLAVDERGWPWPGRRGDLPVSP